MKIAILSDFHLGFAAGTEREDECFENAKQAFEIAAEQGADAIILAGDLFDAAIPSQETWERAFKVFPKMQGSSAGAGSASVAVETRDGKKRELSVSLPVIAIHGTHEFRTKDYTNAMQVLESAGCVIYIHAAVAVIGKNSERVAVHGLGGVPEKKALDALRAWGPKPRDGMKNIVVMHQSIKEYLPFGDDMVATVSCADLPRGFDLVVNGHLHMHSEKQLDGTKLIMPGSTIITQMKKAESRQPKGICIYDSAATSTGFLPLPKQRTLVYHVIEFRGAKPSEVLEKARSAITGSLATGHGMPPLVRLKLKGVLAKGFSQSDVLLAEIEKEFAGKAVLSISKDFFTEQFKTRIAELREAHNRRRSVASMGFAMLEKNLAETEFGNAFDVQRVFELLADNKTDEALELLSKLKDAHP